MTGKELLEKLQKLSEEELNLPVNFPYVVKDLEGYNIFWESNIELTKDNQKDPWFLLLYPNLEELYKKYEARTI